MHGVLQNFNYLNSYLRNPFCLTIKNYAMSDSFADFVNELETAEQPEVCSMDNPECEACGS